MSLIVPLSPTPLTLKTWIQTISLCEVLDRWEYLECDSVGEGDCKYKSRQWSDGWKMTWNGSLPVSDQTFFAFSNSSTTNEMYIPCWIRIPTSVWLFRTLTFLWCFRIAKVLKVVTATTAVSNSIVMIPLRNPAWLKASEEIEIGRQSPLHLWNQSGWIYSVCEQVLTNL